MKIELQYIIKNITFDVNFKTYFFDEETEKEICHFVKHMSKEIYIDKSYVKCQENKYSNVFLTLDGWESLKNMLLISSYGAYLNNRDQSLIINVFATMCECYILCSLVSYFNLDYICISDYIELKLNKQSIFDVIILKDTATEWKNNTIKE